jgi:predicted TIM-barrel fold metal-dependent hydrolase
VPVIDTHAHDVPLLKKLPVLFDRLGGALPRVEAGAGGRSFLALAPLLADMDRAGVTASLVVLYAEIVEFLRLALEQPGRLYGLAYYDSLHPAESLDRVHTLCAEYPDLILGVSTAFPFFRQDPRLNDFQPLYRFCQERGLPIQFHMGGDPAMEALSRPAAFGVLAATFPGLPVICLHAGGGAHRELLALLQRLPNLYVEVEGLQENELEGGRPVILHEILRAAPSRKVMFGSNRIDPEGPYAARVRAVRTLPWRQRADVCWRTAAAVYRLRIANGKGAPTRLAHALPR